MYIGIDLGTSAVKLLLMEKDGEILNIVSREYPIAFPHPGWSEQDPADWWNAVKEGIPALLHSFAHADCAQKLVKIKSETRPDPKLAQKYNAEYAVWKQLYPLLRPIEKEL